MKSTVSMGVLFGLGLAVLGCNKPKGPNNPTAQGSASASADVGETPEPSSDGPQPAGANDAPEISRSLGAADGVVVFWPRIIPRSTDPATTKLAKDVQDHLVGLVKKALPGKAVDVRPEPERVCPRDGCLAMTVGVLLTSTEGGCVTVGLVAGPGKAESHLVPWGGTVQLKSETVAFRDPPEAQITIRDHAKCSAILEKMTAKDEAIVQAIQAAAK